MGLEELGAGRAEQDLALVGGSRHLCGRLGMPGQAVESHAVGALQGSRLLLFGDAQLVDASQARASVWFSHGLVVAIIG